MTFGLAIIETRPLTNIREIIENHIYFTGWPVTFFHGLGNAAFVKKELKGLNVKFRELRVTELSESGYNNLLTSTEFWEAIPYDKVLIFQHDSRLLRKGVEEFLQWDFVGAPWKWQQWGCNGGCSLRQKETMLQIIKTNSYNQRVHGNEDVFFSNIMQTFKMNLAPREVCERFGVEAVYKLGTFSFHAIDKWLSPKQCDAIRSQYELTNA